MAGIVFYFENSDIDVYSGRDADLSAWNHLCKVADIQKAIVINKSSKNVVPFDSSMEIEVVTEIPSLTGHVTQLVLPNEREDSISLWDFDHQTDWYIFGSASGWFGNHFGDQYVHVPQNTAGAAYSMQIGTVAMYDRYRKLWQ